jgi:hypothetical protein
VSFAIEQLTAEGYLSTSQGRRPVVVAGTSLLSSVAGPRQMIARFLRVFWMQALLPVHCRA